MTVTVVMVVFGLPVIFDGHDSIGAVVAQVLVVFLTLVAAVMAISVALGYFVRPSKMLSATYAWTAVGVLAGNAALFVLDYWPASERSYAHYLFAPVLGVISVCAVAPALAGFIVNVVQKLADHRGS
jgi:hypothetical protein